MTGRNSDAPPPCLVLTCLAAAIVLTGCVTCADAERVLSRAYDVAAAAGAALAAAEKLVEQACAAEIPECHEARRRLAERMAQAETARRLLAEAERARCAICTDEGCTEGLSPAASAARDRPLRDIARDIKRLEGKL